MFNLLRMDLYRIKRSKFIYVCFVCMLAVIALCYLLVWLMGTPEGQKTALKIGMLELSELEEGQNLLEGANLLGMFRESNMDGGLYNLIFGIAVALLVCGDYQQGFMKNIMPLHRERWTYVSSKLMASAILNLLYLVASYAFTALMNLVFQGMVPWADWRETLFYLGWAWVLTTGFAALINHALRIEPQHYHRRAGSCAAWQRSGCVAAPKHHQSVPSGRLGGVYHLL